MSEQRRLLEYLIAALIDSVPTAIRSGELRSFADRPPGDTEAVDGFVAALSACGAEAVAGEQQRIKADLIAEVPLYPLTDPPNTRQGSYWRCSRLSGQEAEHG